MYIRSFPCAAKRVRSRSSGYVVAVAIPPATAPETNDSAVGGRRCGSSWRIWVVVR